MNMKKLCLALGVGCYVFCALAESQRPQLVPDYNRDGVINDLDRELVAQGVPFTIWLNDDDDAMGAESDGQGDTNIDLHDVPNGEGNDKDCEDDEVNGRCDLLDFFPVLVDVSSVSEWDTYNWSISSKSVNVVFTQLQAHNAGDFHTMAEKGVDGETPLYCESVAKLVDDDVTLPEDGFLCEGRGVFLIEGAALAEGGLTLRGEKEDSLLVEVTLDVNVKNVEDMFGRMNLRGTQPSISLPLNFSTAQPATRHFIFVHGYNTNHDEARGNAAEFYKKLWQSGSDAMFTSVEWRGDQSQIKLEVLGVNITPNYYANVENAFAAARPFAEACTKLPGEKILVGHSLGNVLISSAIKDYGLDYTKYVMLNAAVAREAYDARVTDTDMIDDDWLDTAAIPLLERASHWYENFADKKYDPYEYRRKLSWRGRFANLPRTLNYYSQSDNVLVNPEPNEPDLDEVLDRNDPDVFGDVRDLLLRKLVNGKAVGRDGAKKTGFGFWSFSEKIKGTWILDVVNDVLTNILDMAQSDAMKREGGWGANEVYEMKDEFDPANTRFTPFLDERMKTRGMLDILPAETEHVQAQHLADAIPAESFAAGANPVATLENVNMEEFIGENLDWPLYEGDDGEGMRTNIWNHSAFREVAFYHTSKFYASLAALEKPRVIIDTDLGSSMDDLFAVDLAARMHKAGKLDLMAVMMNRPDKSDPDGKGEFLTFADRYLASLGLGDLPLGASTPCAEDTQPKRVFNPYWTLIYSNNVTGVGLLMPTNRTDAQLADLPNAVSLYRRLLADAPDKSVVICSTGFLSNLKALMASGANYDGDDIASTGLELIAAKVKELRIMGGCFDSAQAPDGMGGAEYNAAGNPDAAKKVFEEWPTPVIASPWEVGLDLEYKSKDVLADFPPGTINPVVRAVYTHWAEPSPHVLNRLWDVMTVLPLTEGEMLAPLSENGWITVDDKGVTSFTPDEDGTRRYQVASNRNVTAVMSRYREICRTGNPSIKLLASGKPEPGVDYNGSELVFQFANLICGNYAEEDLKFNMAIDGTDYAPESLSWDESHDVLRVRFVIPPDAVTAGNAYDGVLTITFENDIIGTNVIKEIPTQFVQGRQERAESTTDWFNEMEFETPTNYVPAAAMVEQCLAAVEVTVVFTGQTFVVEYLSPANTVQGAVRIVADGADGYKFQYFACIGKTNGASFVRDWWDFNVDGEDVWEIKPVVGRDYTIRAELNYFDDTHGGENTLVISVGEVGSNQGIVKQFFGNIVNEAGGQGGSTRLHAVEFLGNSEIEPLIGNYYTNVVNATLARIDGKDEYATVAEAVAAGADEPIRLLHTASWCPSAADIGRSFTFLNKSLLVLDLSDLPSGIRLVWSDEEGNNGTLTLVGEFLTPGQSSDPFDSAELAQAAIASGAVGFAPTPDVERVLKESTILTIEGYKVMFAPVIYSSDDKYRVRYTLTETGMKTLESSVRTLVTNLNPQAIATAPVAGVDRVLAGGMPGFYYTLFKSQEVTIVTDVTSRDPANSDRLCDKDGFVTFEQVTKPSAAAGFFTVRVSPKLVFTDGVDVSADIIIVAPVIIERVE